MGGVGGGVVSEQQDVRGHILLRQDSLNLELRNFSEPPEAHVSLSRVWHRTTSKSRAQHLQESEISGSAVGEGRRPRVVRGWL